MSGDPVDKPAPVLILTNDDGIDAPGLRALYEAAAGLGRRQVIAPAEPWSGRSHAVTTHGPIRIVARDDWIGIAGTPADCVRLGLHHLAPAARWVLAGINAGANLGADIHHSGTVAAAREAVLHGQPAIALSHYIARGRAIDWPQATRWAASVMRTLIGRPLEPGSFWNVNLPHLEPGGAEPAIVDCTLDPSPLPLRFQIEGDQAQYTGDYQSRTRRPAADIDVCFRGQIAVTLVRVFPPPEDPTG